jgi:protease I
MSSKIAFLLGEGFEDSEFRVPYDRLREAGYTVDVIGAQAGQELKGYRGKEKARTDRGIDEVRPDDYAALVLPGGQSPDHLRADRRFVQFVQRFDDTGRPLAAVCHGPQLLITAGLVRGRTLTAWKTIQDDLRQVGANVVDRPVVIDRNWITSRQPDDLEAFSGAVLEALQGERGDVTEDDDAAARRPTVRDVRQPGMSAQKKGE